MRTIGIAFTTMTMLATSACRSESPEGAGRTEHDRDSIIGRSTLPGARGVRAALDASDSSPGTRRSAGLGRELDAQVGDTHQMLFHQFHDGDVATPLVESILSWCRMNGFAIRINLMTRTYQEKCR